MAGVPFTDLAIPVEAQVWVRIRSSVSGMLVMKYL